MAAFNPDGTVKLPQMDAPNWEDDEVNAHLPPAPERCCYCGLKFCEGECMEEKDDAD